MTKIDLDGCIFQYLEYLFQKSYLKLFCLYMQIKQIKMFLVYCLSRGSTCILQDVSIGNQLKDLKWISAFS